MTIMFTPIRVVCNNTITLALNQDGMTGKFRVLHLQMFDEEIMQSAEQALGISGEQMKTFQEQSEFLASKKAKQEHIDNYIAEMLQPKLLIERAKADGIGRTLGARLHQKHSKICYRGPPWEGYTIPKWPHLK